MPSSSEPPAGSPPSGEKLHQVLPQELREVAPYSLLLANRMPDLSTQYSLAFWVAMELHPEMAERYRRFAGLRSASSSEDPRQD
jgi:hypothetical protein